MTASAGRTALFPIGPTRPRSYAPVVTPHEHKRQFGHVHWAGANETLQAIDAALAASHWVNACGFSGHGLMQAPEVGRLTAEQITDGAITSGDTSALQLERFAASAAADRVGLVF